jgi:hypothetical protein
MKRFARDFNCGSFVFSIISVSLEILIIFQRLHVIWTVSMARQTLPLHHHRYLPLQHRCFPLPLDSEAKKSGRALQLILALVMAVSSFVFRNGRPAPFRLLGEL